MAKKTALLITTLLTHRLAYRANRAWRDVKAPTALVADTLATVLIINPTLKQKLERHFNAQAIIINFNQLS